LSTYDFLVPGGYFCDLVFAGIPEFPSLGCEVYAQHLSITVGGALNTVIALRRLGAAVGWAGTVGDDLFSRFVLDLVEQEGVDTRLLTRLETPFQRVTVAMPYQHDRAFLSYADRARPSVEVALELVDQLAFRHLHFNGFQHHPRAVELLDQMRERGIPVSMDCQHIPITLDAPFVRDILSRVAIFMPNAREALSITGCDTLPAAAEVLRALAPLLVIKDGANGAFAWQGDQTWHQPALDLTPLDTTGAGDVFNAGFLYAHLQELEIAECLRWGNICGGLSTLKCGGAMSAPCLERVQAMLAGDAHPT
jgi:sugar/nucleoside kinase (ribokinase family)